MNQKSKYNNHNEKRMRNTKNNVPFSYYSILMMLLLLLSVIIQQATARKNTSSQQLLLLLSSSLSSSSSIITIILVTLISQQQIRYVTGFASWLKCYVDLNDPEEVIMNYNIVLSKDVTDEENAYIEVQFVNNDKNDNDVWYNSNTISTFPVDDPITRMYARLHVPDSIQNNDIQYVIEIVHWEQDHGAAQFVRPVMCNGRRSHSKHQSNDRVVLEIDHIHHPKFDTLQLIAAWAKGHEPVTITPILSLQRQQQQQQQQESEQEEKQQQQQQQKQPNEQEIKEKKEEEEL